MVTNLTQNSPQAVRYHYARGAGMSRWSPVLVEFNGVRMSLRQLALASGLKPRTVLSRYRRAKTLDAAELTRPADPKYTRRGSW